MNCRGERVSDLPQLPNHERHNSKAGYLLPKLSRLEMFSVNLASHVLARECFRGRLVHKRIHSCSFFEPGCDLVAKEHHHANCEPRDSKVHNLAQPTPKSSLTIDLAYQSAIRRPYGSSLGRLPNGRVGGSSQASASRPTQVARSSITLLLLLVELVFPGVPPSDGSRHLGLPLSGHARVVGPLWEAVARIRPRRNRLRQPGSRKSFAAQFHLCCDRAASTAGHARAG